MLSYYAAKALELDVFAVGVSNLQDSQILQDIGFRKGQGVALGQVIKLALNQQATKVCA